MIAHLVAAQIGVTYKPLFPEYYGLEGEWGPVGALIQVQRWERQTGTPEAGTFWQGPARATVWGRWPVTLPAGLALDAIGGLNWYPDSAMLGQALPDAWRYVGPVLGVSYTLTSGRLWLRVSPNVTLSPDPPYREGLWWLKSGIPWVEAGFRPFPGLNVSFRASEAFLKLAWEL